MKVSEGLQKEKEFISSVSEHNANMDVRGRRQVLSCNCATISHENSITQTNSSVYPWINQSRKMLSKSYIPSTSSLMYKLWTVGLCLTVIWCYHTTIAQDTMLLHHHRSYHRKENYHCSKHCVTLMDRLEQRLHHRVRDSEHRCNKRLQAQFSANNRSTAIAYTEKLLHHVLEELQISKESEVTKAADFEKLRQTVSNQQHDLHRSKNTIDRMEKQVEDLSSLVETLIGENKKISDELKKVMSNTGSQVTSENSAVLVNTPTTDANTHNQNLPFQPLFPVDCQDVYDNHGGSRFLGFSYIMIQPYTTHEPFEVCCSMKNNSGWTVIQRREDGSVDFYRNWDEYKHGFGNPQGEFWLGNEHIYELTNQGDYMLRVEMEDWEGNSYWAEYEHFRISDENDKYRLHVHDYHGNAGDSLTIGEKHDNQAFSTYDQDHDGRYYDNCAEHYHGAWWFRSCFQSHLNGKYYAKGTHNNFFVRNGIQWNSIHIHSSLKRVLMMIRPTKTVNHDAINPAQNQI